MVRLFWFVVGILGLLWLLLEFGIFQGHAAFVVNRILRTAWSLACLLFIPVLIWAPGLVRESTAGISQFWERLSARRREIDDLRRKIAHLDKPHHMALLGNVYWKQGRYAQAIDWFLKALEKDPALLDAQYKLGLCRFQQGEFKEAAERLDQVCAEKPQHDYGVADLRLAQSHQRLGNFVRAEEVYQTLLRFYPGHPEGSFHYALLKADQNALDRARDLMQEVVFSVRHSPRFQRRRNRHWLLKARLWLWRH